MESHDWREPASFYILQLSGEELQQNPSVTGKKIQVLLAELAGLEALVFAQEKKDKCEPESSNKHAAKSNEENTPDRLDGHLSKEQRDQSAFRLPFL